MTHLFPHLRRRKKAAQAREGPKNEAGRTNQPQSSTRDLSGQRLAPSTHKSRGEIAGVFFFCYSLPDEPTYDETLNSRSNHVVTTKHVGMGAWNPGCIPSRFETRQLQNPGPEAAVGAANPDPRPGASPAARISAGAGRTGGCRTTSEPIPAGWIAGGARRTATGKGFVPLAGSLPPLLSPSLVCAMRLWATPKVRGRPIYACDSDVRTPISRGLGRWSMGHLSPRQNISSIQACEIIFYTSDRTNST